MAKSSPVLRGKKSSNYGDNCFVPLCYNQRGKDKEAGITRSYFSFPPSGSKRCEDWIRLIRRVDRRPKSWDKVCSDHFVNGW